MISANSDWMRKNSCLMFVSWIANAGERRIMGEHVLDVPMNWPAEGASRSGVAGENIIKNFLDICVVFFD